MGHTSRFSLQRRGRPAHIDCLRHISFRTDPSGVYLSRHHYATRRVMVVMRANLDTPLSDDQWNRAELKIHEVANIRRSTRSYMMRTRTHACWLSKDRHNIVILVGIKVPIDDLPPLRFDRLEAQAGVVRVMGMLVIPGVIYGNDPSTQLTFYVDREIKRIKHMDTTILEKAKRFFSSMQGKEHKK